MNPVRIGGRLVPSVPDGEKREPEFVRAVSEFQANAGLKWVETVRSLNEFHDMGYTQNNKLPGSSIHNVTNNLGTMPDYMQKDVEWKKANFALQETIKSVDRKIHKGYASDNISLVMAIHKIIKSDAKPEQVQGLIEKFDACVAAIDEQTRKTKFAFEELDLNYYIRPEDVKQV